MEPDRGEHLGVNEWHAGLCPSLVQLKGLSQSYEVLAGEVAIPICCTAAWLSWTSTSTQR